MLAILHRESMTKPELPRGATEGDVAQVRAEVRRLGPGESQRKIKEAVCLRDEKTGRILRWLEARGEYNGFSRPVPARYKP